MDHVAPLTPADANLLYALADAVRRLSFDEVARLTALLERGPHPLAGRPTVERLLAQVQGRASAWPAAAATTGVPDARVTGATVTATAGTGSGPSHPRGNESVTREDLQRALLLTLVWLDAQLPEFGVASTGGGTFDKRDVARLKPVSELALTLEVLHRCGIRIPVLDRMADAVWEQVEGGRLLLRLLLARNDFLPVCALYASMERLGYRDNNLRRVVAEVATSDLAAVLPLQPWAALALRHNLLALGLPAPAIPERLVVPARAEPWVVSAEIGYAITHEIFYLTDFGRGPDRLGEPTTDYLRTWIPYWAQVFAAADDYDLVGELAMSRACLSTSWSEAAGGTPFGPVLAAQDSDGSVAGPEGAGGYLRAKDDSDERKDFLRRHHTTLVTSMACALGLALPYARSW